MASKGVSIRLACLAFGVSESCYCYRPKLGNENEELAGWLIKLTERDTDWGFGLFFDYFWNVKGSLVHMNVCIEFSVS